MQKTCIECLKRPCGVWSAARSSPLPRCRPGDQPRVGEQCAICARSGSRSSALGHAPALTQLRAPADGPSPRIHRRSPTSLQVVAQNPRVVAPNCRLLTRRSKKLATWLSWKTVPFMRNQAPGYFHFNILRGLYWKIVPFLHT